MEDFLTKLQKISKQSNNLIWEKNLIEKRISNSQENIKKYNEMKQKHVEEVELKKNQLLKNKNKHLIKCQKMEELNNKLNEILIRKQNIDDEENKIVVLKQIDVIKKMFHLLKNVQMLSDSLGATKEDYISITEQIHNQNFSNRKTINILNCLLKKNIASVQDREKEEKEEKEDEDDREKEKGVGHSKEIEGEYENKGENTEKFDIEKAEIVTEMIENNKIISNTQINRMLKVIPTKEMNSSLINLFSQSHTNLSLEKQQFLFVFVINILKKILNKQKQMEKEKPAEKKTETEKEEIKESKKNEGTDIAHINEKYNNTIHQFLYQHYIAIQ